MKLFIITEAVSDDDGNFYSQVHSTHKTKEEAIDELKKLHDETIEYFNDPEDDYEDGDNSFEISEADDFEIRNYACIDEVEI